MQFRRREEDHAARSLSPKLRSHHRLDSAPDLFRRNRVDGLDRLPVQQRKMNPLKVGDGFEGRDSDWRLTDRRSGRVQSRSPPVDQMRKNSHFHDGVDHRNSSRSPLGLRTKYEYSKSMDYSGVDDESLNTKRVYLDREKGFIESRLGGGKSTVDQRFLRNGNEVGGSYRSIPDIGVSVQSQYEEDGGNFHPPSRRVPTERFEYGRLQHRARLPVDKIPITEPHRGSDKSKTMFHAREVSYSKESPSYAKDFAGTSSHSRDYGKSSMEMRSDFLCSHGDCVCSRASYDQLRGSGKLAEGVGFSGHGHRPPVNTSRGPEIGHRNIPCHQCELSPSPTRIEHSDYYNSRLYTRASHDEYLHQYDDISRRVAPHGRLDYEQAVTEYDNRELSRHYISHPDLDRTGKSEDYYGNPRRGIMHEHDHSTSENPKYVEYHDMRRASVASKQSDAYLRSGYNHTEMGKRMPNDYEVSYQDAPEADHQISNLRTEYEFGRDGARGLQQERFQSSPLSKHDSETYRQAARVQEMNQDVSIHNHSDRHMKRKYYANGEIDVHDLRTIKSSKWDDAPEEYEDYYVNEEWVDDEDLNMLYSYDNVGSNHKIYRKHNNNYNELENEEGFPSNNRISPQVSMERVQRPPFRFQKYSNQNIRHSKSSQHFSRRNANQKQSKGWKKYHGYNENKHTTNDESYEDLDSAAEPQPTEDSEEFLQMVHENFLMYSKKLNLNLSVQRRYLKQGKAGGLYCIVCGRSSSKEFMDTRSLVTHAFMSHKTGLRAKHLGLHQAICVMMGWDTTVPQDTVTWAPQVLPHAETLAQKEDLILWPPVVIIHNISMSDDNPQNWKVISMETIEAFIRGKGFVRGRIKLCLGKPADQSTILVKFLGTFVGLGDAERIHKYLSDNNRGRADYEKIKSEGVKSCNIRETDQGDQVESFLYGYVAIAEDLEKLDFNSKSWSSVKSRKEIDDLDKAPVKTDEMR
ncbi:hypothetical protein RYX36_020038 [Vicia faba]